MGMEMTKALGLSYEWLGYEVTLWRKWEVWEVWSEGEGVKWDAKTKVKEYENSSTTFSIKSLTPGTASPESKK